MPQKTSSGLGRRAPPAIEARLAPLPVGAGRAAVLAPGPELTGTALLTRAKRSGAWTSVALPPHSLLSLRRASKRVFALFDVAVTEPLTGSPSQGRLDGSQLAARVLLKPSVGMPLSAATTGLTVPRVAPRDAATPWAWPDGRFPAPSSGSPGGPHLLGLGVQVLAPKQAFSVLPQTEP